MRPARREAAGNRARRSDVTMIMLDNYNVTINSNRNGVAHFRQDQRNEVMGATDDAPCMQRLIDCPAMFDDSVSTGMCTQDCSSNGSPLDVEFAAGSTVQDSGLANGNGKQCFTTTTSIIRALTSICGVKC